MGLFGVRGSECLVVACGIELSTNPISIPVKKSRQQPLRLCFVAIYLRTMKERRQVKRLDGPVRRVVRQSATAALEVPEPPIVSGLVADGGASLQPIAAPLQAHWLSRFRFSRKTGVLLVTALLVAVVAGVTIKAVMASQRIVTKNNGGGAPALQGDIDPTKLKGEGDGRINILLLGVGGGNHNGGTLSDTIMVASIDPVNKTVAMLSIPRDLYVKIPGYGYGKINTANSAGGPELAKEVVGQVLDLPIHYYMQADFAGFKQAVDAVGGVDINNTTKLYDPEYPCDNDRGYCTFNLPIGQYHLDGQTALKFARCRHGSCGNDFGRAARQQQLLVALRDKALKASTLTNPVKLSGLIDSVGDHVRTDLQIKELQKLATIVKDIDISKATNKVLDNGPDGLLVSGDGKYAGAGSILLPRAGDFDYSEIQELAHSIFVDGYIEKEKAVISLENATAKDGFGGLVAKQLTAYSYDINEVTTAPETQATSTIIDYSNGKKPYTVKYLEDRFHVKAVRQTRPTLVDGTTSDTDIVIIVGSDYRVTSAATGTSAASTSP